MNTHPIDPFDHSLIKILELTGELRELLESNRSDQYLDEDIAETKNALSYSKVRACKYFLDLDIKEKSFMLNDKSYLATVNNNDVEIKEVFYDN